MEIVFHVHFYISISIGFFQVLFKFYANFWGYSSFINGLNRKLASQVSTERSLSCHPAFTRAMRQAGMLASRFADCHVHRDKYSCLNVWTKGQPSPRASSPETYQILLLPSPYTPASSYKPDLLPMSLGCRKHKLLFSLPSLQWNP